MGQHIELCSVSFNTLHRPVPTHATLLARRPVPLFRPYLQVRGVWGLIDVMDNYVSAVDARMVVMGSQHLTSNDFNYIIGSITLSALKRLHVPVMVVTANSRQNCAIGSDWEAAAGGGGAAGGKKGGAGGGGGAKPGSGGGVRCLTLVENQNYAKNMMGFLCTQLLDGKRGDRLLLAQVQVRRGGRRW